MKWPANPGATLFVVVLGTTMVGADTNIVILALPTITKELHSQLSAAIWALLSYLFVNSVLATQLGRVGDIFGRKRIYNAGFAVFTVGSALCGFSFDMIQLVAFRILQGLGGAMMAANSGAILADVYPVNVRGRAFGYSALGWNIGATLGIVLGGFITTVLGWRYIFFINVPIGILGVVAGARLMQPSAKTESSLDIPGIALIGALLAFVTFGAWGIASYGLDLTNSGLLLVGLAILIPLIVVERRSRSPTLDLAAFRNRVLGFSLGASFLQSIGYLSETFMVIMYLQGIRGYSPLYASLILVPGYLISSGVSPSLGRLADRFGARVMATAGIALMLASMAFYVTLEPGTPVLWVVIANTVSSFGAMAFYPANNSAVMANAPARHYGSVSGLLRSLVNMGSLLSYVVATAAASLAVPRSVAFSVFLGTSNLIGGVSLSFLEGLKIAFLVTSLILFASMVMSMMRGKDVISRASPPSSS